MNPAESLFHRDVAAVSREAERAGFLREGLAGYRARRTASESAWLNWEHARDEASAIKWEAIDRLPDLLESFEARLLERGAEVYWARDAEEARGHVLRILESEQARRVVKSKTMTSEEIGLNEALEAADYEVLETDLGEYIQQLRGEPPFHFVMPSMHLKRGEVRETFERSIPGLGALDTDDPAALTMIARRVLRAAYVAADVGISGANFGVAETGHIAITENEGNARLTCALPRVHIALMGIEKMIPRLADLAILHPMLATAGTGQPLTSYNTLYGGPREAGDPDGPRRFVVILIDNGRTNLLADPAMRDALRCIRCGACLNVCPVFQVIGGHAYGTTYQGPIGSVITPSFRGISEFGHLAHASTLCGACTETCPVRIDLHHHLLHIRALQASATPDPAIRAGFRAFAWMSGYPRLFSAAGRAGRWALRSTRFLAGGGGDPFARWRDTRSLEAPTGPGFLASLRSAARRRSS